MYSAKDKGTRTTSVFTTFAFTEQPSDDIAVVAGNVIHNVRSDLNI
jgi:hypothetical protein